MGSRGQHHRDEGAEREWRKLAARRRSFSSTPPRSRRIAPPVAANVWPAPSASGFCGWPEQSAQTYPAFRLSRWPRWRSARSAPHKGDGIEAPFSAKGCRTPSRLSGHLSLTTRRHLGRTTERRRQFTWRLRAARMFCRDAGAPRQSEPSWRPARRRLCWRAPAIRGAAATLRFGRGSWRERVRPIERPG